MTVEKKEVDSSVEKKEDAPEEVRGPARGGLRKRTLKELEMLGIKLKDVFVMSRISINLEWKQVIDLINFNEGKEIIDWNTTFEKALELINVFLW